MSDTRTMYVVDEDGGTFWFDTKPEAEAALVKEAWQGAVHLTITKAEVPTGLPDADLGNWIIANVPPISCEAQ